jgi:hypothetical protein
MLPAALPHRQHSPDDAAQITLMAALLPDPALRQGEAPALLALHRLRFPARDVARLGGEAILRAASERRLALAALPALAAATPAAAHNASLAMAIIPLDDEAAWITVAAVLVAAAVALFGAFIARAFAVASDILRQKSQWDFDDAEYVREVNRRCVRRAKDAYAARSDTSDRKNRP